MTINNINSLSQPTINGLNNLALNELTADTIYLSVLEVNNIVIDDVLTLNNGSAIIADGSSVSCIELSYLDGVSSNIQTQFINNNANIASELTNLQVDISNNKASIFTLRTDISSNDADIIVLQNTINTNFKDNTSLQNQIITIDNQITNLQNITKYYSDTTFPNLQTDVSNNSSSISNLQSDVSLNKVSISNLQSDTSGFYKYENDQLDDYQGLCRSILSIDDGIFIDLQGRASYIKTNGSLRFTNGGFISFNNSFSAENIQQFAFTTLLKNKIENNVFLLTDISYEVQLLKTTINNNCYINNFSCGNFNTTYLSKLTSNVQQQLTDQQQKTLYITRSGTTTTIAEKLVVETIEYTLDGTIQVTAFTDAYKNKLNDIIAEQPKILYRYNNSFTTNETGTASIGSATKTFSAQKVIQTTGNIKMYSGKLYCITGSLFISNLNYLQKLRYSITLLNDSTLINESVSYQSNAIFYNGASGAEFNEFTLLSAPFYFKALNNYTGDLKLQYVILHSVDSKTGTTVQFEGASTLVQIS